MYVCMYVNVYKNNNIRVLYLIWIFYILRLLFIFIFILFLSYEKNVRKRKIYKDGNRKNL